VTGGVLFVAGESCPWSHGSHVSPGPCPVPSLTASSCLPGYPGASLCPGPLFSLSCPPTIARAWAARRLGVHMGWQPDGPPVSPCLVAWRACHPLRDCLSAASDRRVAGSASGQIMRPGCNVGRRRRLRCPRRPVPCSDTSYRRVINPPPCVCV